MIAPLKIQPKPDLDARLAFAACALDGHCFIGWRHGFILSDDVKPRGLYMTQECQGFVDQHGYFWSREVSAQIAYRARQIARPAETIMSEELWDTDGTPRDGWKPDPSRVATPATGELPARGMTCSQVAVIVRAALNRAALGGNMRDAEAAGVSAYLETLTPEVLATIHDRATPPAAPAAATWLLNEWDNLRGGDPIALGHRLHSLCGRLAAALAAAASAKARGEAR